MADANIKKAITYYENLPALSVFEDGSIGYFVRYRVTSEDKSRASAWSQTHIVSVPSFTLHGEVAVSFTNDTITAVWDDEVNRPRYDVFIRWGFAVDQASSSGTTRTLRTVIDHNLVQGDVVNVVLPETYTHYASFNGLQTITSVTADSITYTAVGSLSTNDNIASPHGEILQPDYYFHGTTSNHTYSFIRDLAYDRVHIDIQVEGYKKQYAESLLIYDSPSVALT